MTIVYGISNCDTVKNARAWLTDHSVAHTFHDFKKSGVPADSLTSWIKAVGLDKLLNRQGTTWRKLDPHVQAGVANQASACALILANPSVIKRPVVEWPNGSGQITVGFDAVSWLKMIQK